jgi:hypothetical protein
MSKVITDTGIRGFLKWFQVEQPGIYKKVAPLIQQKSPEAFSDYEGGEWRVAGLTRDEAVDKLNKLGRLGADLTAVYRGTYDLRGLGDQGVDFYTAYAGFPTMAMDANTIPNITASLGTPPAFDTSTLSTPSYVDTAVAANSGPISSTTAQTIGAVVNGASKLILANNQAQLQQSIVNMQLQRASAGLSPLPISLASRGITTVGVSGSISGGSTMLLLGAGLLAFLLLGKKAA